MKNARNSVTVRLVVAGVSDYPYVMCDAAGMVMARFKTIEDAEAWAVRRHFEIEPEVPDYLD